MARVKADSWGPPVRSVGPSSIVGKGRAANKRRGKPPRIRGHIRRGSAFGAPASARRASLGPELGKDPLEPRLSVTVEMADRLGDERMNLGDLLVHGMRHRPVARMPLPPRAQLDKL